MWLPLLADFGTRLAGGLAGLMLLTPSKAVPPAFFRTHCQIILALLVLGALDEGRSGSGGVLVGVTIGTAVAAYVASVAWGIGLPRLGMPFTAAVTSATGAVLVLASRGPSGAFWTLDALGRLSSAFLLGSTLTAMLLGHHYLTAPAMSIDPLRRFVRCMAAALGIRGALAALGVFLWLGDGISAPMGNTSSLFFLGMRWGMGLAGPALATYLAWETVKIRSTQSATGILYIAMTLVLIGELTALVLGKDAGVAFL